LYTEGGVYLDSDVIVRKSFDDFLQYDFFTAVECAASVVGKLEQPRLQAAIMGGIKGHPYLKDILNWYGTHHFTDTEYNIKLVAPDVYAQIAEKYGFQHKNELQVLKNNMVIFPSAVFAMSADSATREAFAVHCCKSSWREHQFYLQCVIRNKLLRKLFGKRPLKNISDVLKESF
jgi:hypothetical protein